MGDVCTILSLVQNGAISRVRIAWPNGGMNYFGKFASEKEARGWMADHASLTKPRPPDAMPPQRIKRPKKLRHE
jgi:hypothetical protein